MEKGSAADDILVAVTKPVRGREMIATKLPSDMFDSMRLVSAKRTDRSEDLTTELNKPKKENVETYYEGYVDGKKYLVPDSNLEAMKDVINLGMRQRRSTRFRHQTSLDIEDEMTLARIDKMLAKIRELNLSLSVDESRSSTKSGDPIKTSEERVSQSTLTKEGEFSLPASSLLSTEKRVSREHKSKEQQSQEEEESDDCYLRLVLSGHFKNNEKPIYIIQEYNTKSKLFCQQSADFTSSQSQGNVHIFMAGKLFNDNILEETDGKPTSLNLKPNKIIIDPGKCKIFRSYFENTYSRKATDITIKGEFIQNDRSMDITPYLSLAIKQNNMDMAFSDNNNKQESDEKRPSILVKNRLSQTSSSMEIPKDTKRVSFKESSDEEDLHVIYKNIKRKKTDDSLPTQSSHAKKEGRLQNKLNENQKINENKQIVAKRKVIERIFYLFTENSLFKKLFTKRK